MPNTTPMRAVVNPSASVNKNQSSVEISLVNTDGTAASTIKKQAAQADTTAADLAALKVDFNALLTKLRAAGVISA